MKKIISIIASVLSSVIGIIVCASAVTMPFDSSFIFYAPATLFIGSLLLLLPPALICRKLENGAIVLAATIISIAMILAAAILASLGYAANYHF